MQGAHERRAGWRPPDKSKDRLHPVAGMRGIVPCQPERPECSAQPYSRLIVPPLGRPALDRQEIRTFTLETREPGLLVRSEKLGDRPLDQVDEVLRVSPPDLIRLAARAKLLRA